MTQSCMKDEAQVTATGEFDVERLRLDFPALHQEVNGKPLVYLDSAATAQKPQCVIDAISHYYANDNANIHRGVHTLSVRATSAYEDVREKTKRLIHASQASEIVFVRSTTEAINLVAQTLGANTLKPGDEVLITQMEHHSNIVPWQMICKQTGASLRVAPINDQGELDLAAFEKLLTDDTKIVAVAHVSNALGSINPIEQITRLAHDHGAVVVVDGAQAAPHLAVDVQAIGCDFYALSSHKMFGPTGVGVLFGRRDLLEELPPYQGGGEMIRSVTFDDTTYNDVPYRFEAGTPNIAGVIGFGAAIDYVQQVGFDAIQAYEHELLLYATELLLAQPLIQLVGTAADKAAVISFVVDGVHAHDVGTIMDQQGIAVRTGHHCAQPAMERFGLTATTRASLAFYNTKAEIDALVEGLQAVAKVFG